MKIDLNIFIDVYKMECFFGRSNMMIFVVKRKREFNLRLFYF